MTPLLGAAPTGLAATTFALPPCLDLHWRRFPLLFLFGATIGAGLDYLHTDGDEIRYPEDTNHWRGIWTMGALYSIVPTVFCVLQRLLGDRAIPKPYFRTAPTVGIYCLMYGFTAYGDIHSFAIAAILFLVGLVLWFLHDRSFSGFVASAIAAIGGAVLEGTLSSNGRMQYSVQDVGGVPLWLPALYWLSGPTWGLVCKRALTIRNHCGSDDANGDNGVVDTVAAVGNKVDAPVLKNGSLPPRAKSSQCDLYPLRPSSFRSPVRRPAERSCFPS